MLGEYYPSRIPFGYVTQVTYFACGGGCDNYNSWNQVDVTPRGNGAEPAWDLEIDQHNHPRTVVYHEDTEDSMSKKLFYYQCDSDCFNTSAWQSVDLGLDKTIGMGADLALDAQGLPRIAHLVNDGTLAYSWCNTNCLQSASWLHAVVDTVDALDASNTAPIPTSCVQGVWSNYAPSLTLDPQGNSRIAYNTTYNAQCPNKPKPGELPSNSFQEVIDQVRVFFAAQQYQILFDTMHLVVFLGGFGLRQRGTFFFVCSVFRSESEKRYTLLIDVLLCRRRIVNERCTLSCQIWYKT